MAGLDSNVKLLCHFDGEDQQTTTVDSSEYEHILTAETSARIVTAQSKFGGASTKIESWLQALWETPYSDDWDFMADNTQPFTIDLWVRWDSLSWASGFIGQSDGTWQYWGFVWKIQGTDQLWFKAAGSGSQTHHWACDFTPTIEQWYHVAAVRDASENHYLFIDGVEQTLVIDSKQSARPKLYYDLDIGKINFDGTGYTMRGHLDELRLSDVARWTEDFTPPVFAYDDAALDLYDADEIPLVLAQPAPTVLIEQDVTLTPDVLSLSLAPETTHINSNEVNPAPVSIGIVPFDPFILFGTEYEATLQTLALNVWTPTIYIETATIVFPDALELTATFQEAVASPVWAAFASSLPMFTLNASIVDKLNFASSLPMFTLEATCIIGQIFSVIKPLPMLTLNIRAGTKVDIGLPILTLSASGTNTNGSRLVKSLPMFTLNASGKGTNYGTLGQNECGVVSLPMITVNIVMALGGIHSLESTLPVMVLNAAGITGGTPGILEAALPLIEISASGYASGNGALTKSLPILSLDAFGTSYINRII